MYLLSFGKGIKTKNITKEFKRYSIVELKYDPYTMKEIDQDQRCGKIGFI